jgi:adenylate cyclase
MVLANDEDQRQWGWPLSDKDLARLLENLLSQQPVAIGLDIYRDLPVPLAGGPDYEHLTQVFKNNENFYAIMKYQDHKGARVDPPPALEGTERIGFNDIPIDSGGVIRRGLLYVGDEEGNVFEFFGLKLALHYLSALDIVPQGDPEDPYAMILGKAKLRPLEPDFGGYVDQDTAGFQFMLNYPGAPGGFDTLSFNQVLTKQFKPAQVKDKIIIIGVSAEATPDFIYTPFSLWSKGDQRLPGPMAHAYITSQLLRMAIGDSNPMQSLNALQEKIWIGIWCLLGALLGLKAHSLWRFSLAVLSGIFLLLLSSYLAFISHFWILTIAPALGWLASFTLMLTYLTSRERKQRSDLMLILGKHVSKDVAKAIWADREHYLTAGRLQSQRITATVLFTDLQNFTTVSEQMQPQDLMNWLNEYMEVMVDIVEKHDGQVNKFIGDAIMAVFGVPIPSTTPEAIGQDAIHAVECALAMRHELEHLRTKWEAAGLPLIRMRVGIFTGPLVVGSLGGKERQEYTVLGDTVNTASRLESFDKTIDAYNACRILIGEPTLQYLQDRFQTDRVGEVYLKGKQSQVTIYRVVAGLPQSSDA